MNYISVDGGGTKLNAIWYDENMRLKGRARAKGVNSTITPRDVYLNNIKACYEGLFAAGAPDKIDGLYVVCGNTKDYTDCLSPLAEIANIYPLGERTGGLLAGRGVEKGMLAISGTGSDILYEGDDGCDVVGGVGAILGDEGSGVWIARHAVQNAIRYAQGWGERTALTDMLMSRLQLKRIEGMVRYLYDSPAPFQRLGELLPLVAEAARAGDEPCVRAFAKGAEMLAKQTLALISRHPSFNGDIVICGGAWKAFGGMFDEYRRLVSEGFPKANVHRPWFEHVLAGPMKTLLQHGSDPESARRTLLEAFPDYEWRA